MKNIVDARRIYQETALRGATPLELVIVLYDTAIEDMRSAELAMQQNEIEARARRIGHALIVLQQLQGTLDFERGGMAARQFEQFYSLVRSKLLEAQIRNSHALLQEQIRYFSEVRECWVGARRLLEPVANRPAPASPTSLEEGSTREEWRA